MNDATGTLEAIRAREAEAAGIPSLKLAFNNVFGYYLEVRNSHKDKVPEEWHRKQTLVNAERYITDELKKFEVEVLGAEEKIKAIETRLFEALVAQVAGQVSTLLHSARWVATLDVLLGFSEVALKYDYVRPTFTAGLVKFSEAISSIPLSCRCSSEAIKSKILLSRAVIVHFMFVAQK